MPKRKTDPKTGQPELTCREERFVDEFITNGGNASRAGASAGYGAARADQSAYQVLRRPEVQHRIRLRLAESRVTADEIIGTLASIMRGTLADFLDESGNFSIEAAKERGVDHLLRTITTTTREINATKNTPSQVVRTCRGQLYSPIQAAVALARILGIDSKRAQFTRPAPDRQPLIADPSALLEDFIERQMAEQQLSRDAVIECMLQVRPEIVTYLHELPLPQNQAGNLDLPENAQQTAVSLDFITTLASDQDLVGESARQINAISQLNREGVITAEGLQDAVDRITGRLSDPQRNDLFTRLKLEALILEQFAAAESAAYSASQSTAEAATPSATESISLADSAVDASDATGVEDDLSESSATGDLSILTRNTSNSRKPRDPSDASASLDTGPAPSPAQGSKTKTRKYPVLNGLERYLLPTDYITPTPGPWPPIAPPLTFAEVQASDPVRAAVVGHSQFYGTALSPDEEEPEDSQCLSMSKDFEAYR
jgi:hypothetical protein